ncbi:hypothetical protein DVH24_040069 [Malus domestica]|uniref:Uncharacterized protein n=1 Tax=Malus domestica TaxID=3750 RepID=A0A498I2Q5_MALDO|nr:hypothetical protein DVH24_040069 [Malus domestica]
MPSTHSLRPSAKFNLSKILLGRGLCNGGASLLQELKRDVEEEEEALSWVAAEVEEEKPESSARIAIESVQEDGLELWIKS